MGEQDQAVPKTTEQIVRHLRRCESFAMDDGLNGYAAIARDAAEAIAAIEQRNRELMRQVEQLIATVREVIECKSLGGYTADYMRERIGAALAEFTAPPSSAPTDPGRADTGREET